MFCQPNTPKHATELMTLLSVHFVDKLTFALKTW